MQLRPIAQSLRSAVALGCMNFCHAYNTPVSQAQAHGVLHEALDLGITHFDTAALYGFGASEQLVGPVLKAHRSRILLASKGGMAGVTGEDGQQRRLISGRPEFLRQNCEDSLRRLGTEVIDLYYLHRWDKSVPIEDSVGEMGRLRDEGKIRFLGLSEVSAATLRRAHAEQPIAALQSEYSLWTRNAELGTLQACRELGIAYVAFSPMGRGFLAADMNVGTQFAVSDIRATMPRFSADGLKANQPLADGLRAIAKGLNATPAEVAMAWVLHQGEHITALPGTTRIDHLRENVRGAALALDAQTLAQLDALFQPQRVVGNRYALQGQQEVDTETFAV